MAPPKSTARNTPSIPYVDPDNPTWNSSPITLGLWYHSLEDYLFELDKRYRTLCVHGYLVAKQTVITVSIDHSVISLHKLDNTVFGFENPSPLEPFESLLRSNPSKASLVAGFKDANGIKDPAGKRYDVVPESVQELDEALLGAILSTIPDSESRKWLKSNANNSGREALRFLAKEAKKASGKQGGAISSFMRLIIDSGITDESVAGFNALVRQHSLFNKCLAVPLTDALLAETYRDLFVVLGGQLGTMFEVKLISSGGVGDLDKTLEAARDVLGDHEAELARARGDGTALAARDARKSDTHSRAGAPREGGAKTLVIPRDENNRPIRWVEGMSLCPCKGKTSRDNGKHLRRDCPDKAEPAGSARVARGDDDEPLLEEEHDEETVASLFSGRTLSSAAFDSPASLMAALQGGRALVSRGDESGAAAPTKTIERVAHGARFYVLPSGENAGIYFGTWNAPDNIRSKAEGVSADRGKPTSRRASTLQEASVLCMEYGVDPIFFGPIELDDAKIGNYVLPDEVTDIDRDAVVTRAKHLSRRRQNRSRTPRLVS